MDVSFKCLRISYQLHLERIQIINSHNSLWNYNLPSNAKYAHIKNANNKSLKEAHSCSGSILSSDINRILTKDCSSLISLIHRVEYLEKSAKFKWIASTLVKLHHPNTLSAILHNPDFSLQWTFSFIYMMDWNACVASNFFV